MKPDEFNDLILPTDEELRIETWGQRISQANKGHSVTDETKQKISKFHKGKIFTDELKQKLSSIKKGSNRTAETKQKISVAQHNISDETKQKHARSLTEYIIVTPKGEYQSRRELMLAYPELTRGTAYSWSISGKNGFSRKLKNKDPYETVESGSFDRKIV